MEEKNYSDDTARQIDSAVKALVEEAHGRARRILEQKRAALEALAALLQEKEVISGAQAEALLKSQA
jgi:cell division protease FtsH